MCASTQHLMFAEDANSTLWFSNPGGDNCRLAEHKNVR